MKSPPTTSPLAARVREWLGNAGAALVVSLVVVFWGLLDGYEIWDMVLVVFGLGAMFGFFFLALWLMEKVPVVVFPLAYGGAIAALGWVTWLITEEGAVVAWMTVPGGILWLIFTAAAFSARGPRRRRVAPDT